MLLLIIGLLASAIGSYFDATTSIGKREVNLLVRGKDGRFSLKQYVLWQAIWTGLFLIPYFVGWALLWHVGIFNLLNAVIKFLAALHNTKVKA